MKVIVSSICLGVVTEALLWSMAASGSVRDGGMSIQTGIFFYNPLAGTPSSAQIKLGRFD